MKRKRKKIKSFGLPKMAISDEQVIALFVWTPQEGMPSVRYFIDDQNRICSKRTGKPLYAFKAKVGSSTCWFVKLFWKGKCRGISVARLIWIVTMECSPPEGWEVHHLDKNPDNNDPNNLICLHPKDHKKFHLSETQPSLYVPFTDQF